MNSKVGSSTTPNPMTIIINFYFITGYYLNECCNTNIAVQSRNQSHKGRMASQSEGSGVYLVL